MISIGRPNQDQRLDRSGLLRLVMAANYQQLVSTGAWHLHMCMLEFTR